MAAKTAPRNPLGYEHCLRPIDDLRPMGKNARVHSDVQIAKLVAAIKEYGFTSCVIIDEKNGVIAGAGRLMAAREIGMDQVPCIVVPGLSKAQKQALAISDNRLGTDSSWNQDILIETLGEISADGFNLELTGFDDFEITALLAPGHFEDDALDADKEKDKTERAPSITVTVQSAIDIPSVATILRKAISISGYKGVRVKEPRS